MSRNLMQVAKFMQDGQKYLPQLKMKSTKKAFLVMPSLFVALLLILLVYPANSDNDSMTLPPGFSVKTIAGGLTFPVDMEFLPSGDIIVAEKGSGQFEDSWSSIKLVRNGVVQENPVLTLSTNSFWDSGILGLVLDPDFQINHYFYVWYATGINSPGWQGETKLRLSRFEFNPQTGTANPASELLLLEDEPWHQIHHGNGLLFDDAGNLLLSMGNRGNLASSQDLSLLYGKVIRIRPTEMGYEIPPDNPFLTDPVARPEIFTIGFRNPYRLAKRASDGLIVLGDVGAKTWEEIDIITPGANYGFPEREGPCPYGQKKPCDPAPPHFTDPAITYAHDESLGVGTSGAVTGLAFYEGNAFPQEYQNKLFFADFNQNFMASADPLNGTFELFAENSDSIVDIEYFNQGLYLLEIRNGRIVVVFYSGQDNQVPEAALSAAPTMGPSPLRVAFSAAGSSDPDDLVLKYHWDFGDGSPPIITDESDVQHTYQMDGTFQAGLKVVDIRGGESDIVEETITVYSGEFPAIHLENLTAPSRTKYHGGDEWLYEAQRSNLDGLDPAQPFSWQIDFHHNQHSHPLISNSSVISDVLDISTDNHGGDWNLWYKFNLTMFTKDGQEVTVSKEIFPVWVDLQIETRPRSAQISVNQADQLAPHTYRAIVGTEQEIEAHPQTIFEHDIWTFSHWLENGLFVTGDPILLIPAPDNRKRYTATYIYDRPAQNMWLPIIMN